MIRSLPFNPSSQGRDSLIAFMSHANGGSHRGSPGMEITNLGLKSYGQYGYFRLMQSVHPAVAMYRPGTRVGKNMEGEAEQTKVEKRSLPDSTCSRMVLKLSPSQRRADKHENKPDSRAALLSL